MKTKLLNLFVLMVGMAFFAGCSKDDRISPDDPNALRTIKLSVKAWGHVSFELSNNSSQNQNDYEDISFPTDLYIDWGDGSTTSSNSHEYSTEGIYNVTVQAKNLKWFDYNAYYSDGDRGIRQIDLKGSNSLIYINLCYQELTTLDVSGLTALEYLYCSYNYDLSSLNLKGCLSLKELDCSSNDLTSLDIKSCSSLIYVDCASNELSAEALNQIFNDLPQGKTWTDEYGDKVQSKIEFYGNPGSKDCDISILEKKGWKISRY